MSQNTSIEWADHTFNPWWGCTEISPGCDYCYAKTLANRFGTKWGVDAQRREFGDKHWNEPLLWNAKAKAAGQRHRVFCASMADVFDNAAPAGARERLFQLIKATPDIDWLLLTKRIGNVTKMLPANWGNGYANVWLGATVVNQEEADRDVPKLLQVPAAVRFLSMEPLLSSVDISTHLKRGPGKDHQFSDRHGHAGRIHWVIVGGESGANARPMHPGWAQSLRDQCAAAGVPYFFKQWGEWGPYFGSPAHWPHGITRSSFPDGQDMMKLGKAITGDLLDGIQHHEFPGAKA